MNTYDIRDYKSINDAAAACGKNGGGKVVIPEGEWQTGPIRLMSNTELHMDDGAKVIFSDRPEDYLPVVFTRWEGMECYNYSPLIYANGCENVSVTGNGTLFGSGEKWWAWKKLQGPAAKELCYAESMGIPPEKRVYGTKEAALRPSFIQTINCKNVTLKDFTIVEGPQWTIHPVYCEDVTVSGVTVRTTGHNTDGLNPDSCKNVLIENCDFSTGDDCIAINSGMNEDGMRVAKPCENIEIRNCVMRGGHGALTIGSAVSGGVDNVYVHDCKVCGTMQGIRLKSMRGRGGYIRNAKFENITVNNVLNEAIEVNMFYEFSTVMPKSSLPSHFENIEIKNVHGSGAETAIKIKGLPEEPPKNLTLEDIYLTGLHTLEINNAGDAKLDRVILDKLDTYEIDTEGV